jgi:hypothetical protein
MPKNDVSLFVLALIKAGADSMIEEYLSKESILLGAIKKNVIKDFAYAQSNNKAFLTWASRAGLKLSCRIDRKGFYFNEIYCYYDDSFMGVSIEKRFPLGSEKRTLIEKEIKSIKELILLFDERLGEKFK